MVFQLSDDAVVKVPFQYPVAKSLPTDETNEQLYMSLRSFALFKRESAFYSVLAKNPHANLSQRLQCQKPSGIVLPRFRPLPQVWGLHTKATHYKWIKQLVSAVVWLEDLGYTHGDLKVENMGIDSRDQLRLFDYGSVRHRNDEGYAEQVVEDIFALATCIHFLASGIDPVANANSRAEVVQTFRILKGGQGLVDEAAQDFQQVIQAGWTGAVSSFSSLRTSITDIGNHAMDRSKDKLFEAPLHLDSLVVEEDPRWMNEETYRAAWRDMGYDTPDDVWN